MYQLWLSALQGVPTVEFQGAVSLADAYLDDAAGAVEPAIDALVSWQSTRTFGSGFVSGFGGVATMALTIPTALFAAWSTSARLAFAIAHAHGHDVSLTLTLTLTLNLTQTQTQTLTLTLA